MYEYSDESEYGVIAGAPSDDPNSKFVIFEASDDTAHNLFAQYALTNELIRILVGSEMCIRDSPYGTCSRQLRS